MSNKIVVTRHPGMVEYLREIGLIGDDNVHTISIVNRRNEIKNKDVIGTLPLYLACLCNSVTEIPLPKLPPELRGKELTLEQIREYAEEPQTYTVAKVGE